MIFFEPKRRYWLKGEVDTDGRGAPRPRSKRRCVREGTDVTLVAYGPMVPVALAAAEAAAEDGHSSRSSTCGRSRPIDFDTVTASVRKTGRLVVAHEAPTFGGIGARNRRPDQRGAASTTWRPRSSASADSTCPIPLAKVEEQYLPDIDRVLDGVDRALAY